MDGIIELLNKIDPNNHKAFESIYSYINVCSNYFGWTSSNECIEEHSSDYQQLTA